VITVNLLLLILAFICFLAAAISWSVSRVNLTALGLAFWVLSLLIGRTV
jgi:hypothetical protein